MYDLLMLRTVNYPVVALKFQGKAETMKTCRIMHIPEL